MVPNIFTLGIAGLGPLTGKGSGILVMSIVAGTIPPVRVGARANRIGGHHAFLLLTGCYLYGVCNAFSGSKPVVAFSCSRQPDREQYAMQESVRSTLQSPESTGRNG